MALLRNASPKERERLLTAAQEKSLAVNAHRNRHQDLRDKLNAALLSVGNLVEPGVPSGGEDDFVVLDTVGQLRDFAAEGFNPRHHFDLAKRRSPASDFWLKRLFKGLPATADSLRQDRVVEEAIAPAPIPSASPPCSTSVPRPACATPARPARQAPKRRPGNLRTHGQRASKSLSSTYSSDFDTFRNRELAGISRRQDRLVGRRRERYPGDRRVQAWHRRGPVD